jgi:hypothetical protein
LVARSGAVRRFLARTEVAAIVVFLITVLSASPNSRLMRFNPYTNRIEMDTGTEPS